VVGLTTLRKWQKDKTPLCFVSFKFSDVKGMEFWELGPEDIPISDLDLAAFVRFLGMRRSDEDVPLLLVEKAIVH